MCGLRTLVEDHKHQCVALGIDCSKRLRAGRSDDVVVPLNETGTLLTDVEVLHFLIGLIGKTSANGTPLVVIFLHVLPVDPCLRLYVTHVVEQFLSKAEITTYTTSACSHFTHPIRFARLVSQLAEACAIHIVTRVSVGIPLSHQFVDTGTDVAFHSFHCQSNVGLVSSRYDGIETRLCQNGRQNLNELNLRLIVEMTTLLRSVGIPEVSD